MEFLKLEKEFQFGILNKGDLIIVHWKDTARDGRNKPLPEISAYNVYDVKNEPPEVICTKKNNIYFNYKMYLEGKSTAEEVYLVRDIPF